MKNHKLNLLFFTILFLAIFVFRCEKSEINCDNDYCTIKKFNEFNIKKSEKRIARNQIVGVAHIYRKHSMRDFRLLDIYTIVFFLNNSKLYKISPDFVIDPRYPEYSKKQFKELEDYTKILQKQFETNAERINLIIE